MFDFKALAKVSINKAELNLNKSNQRHVYQARIESQVCYHTDYAVYSIIYMEPTVCLRLNCLNI